MKKSNITKKVLEDILREQASELHKLKIDIDNQLQRSYEILDAVVKDIPHWKGKINE